MNMFTEGGKGRDWGVTGDQDACESSQVLGIENEVSTQDTILPEGPVVITELSATDDVFCEGWACYRNGHTPATCAAHPNIELGRTDWDSESDGTSEFIRCYIGDDSFFVDSLVEFESQIIERYDTPSYTLYCAGEVVTQDIWDEMVVDGQMFTIQFDEDIDDDWRKDWLTDVLNICRRRMRNWLYQMRVARLPRQSRHYLEYKRGWGEDHDVHEQSPMVDSMLENFEYMKFQVGDKTIMVNTLLWIESLSCLVTQIDAARNGNDTFLALTSFVRAITGRSFAATLASRWADLMLWIAEVDIDELSPEEAEAARETMPERRERALSVEIVDERVHLQSTADCNNPFTKFRTLFNKIDGLQNSPGMQKMHEMFMYLIANSVLDKLGITMDRCQFTKKAQDYFREKYQLGFGFIYTVLDGVSYILEKLYMVWATRDINALWHTETAYEKFADEYAQIKIDALGLCNPDAFELNYHSFVKRVDECLADGRKILTYIRKVDKPKMQLLIYELEKIRATEVVQKAAARGRRMPFGLLLFGESGVLKTTVENILGTHYGRVRGLPLGYDYRYTIVPTADHMSGFTSRHWWLKIDDAAAVRPGVLNELDPTIRDILQIQNNVAWCPPQAELEMKGKTPCYADFTSVTTNVKHLHARHYFSNDVAIRRRFVLHIEVKVKPQFCKPGAAMADTSKVNDRADGEYPNIWDFVVNRIVEKDTDDGKFADFQPVLETGDIYELLRFFTSEVREHDVCQKNQHATARAILEMSVCDRCFLPTAGCICPQNSLCGLCLNPPLDCECVEEQSLEVIDYVSMLAFSSLPTLLMCWFMWKLNHRVASLQPLLDDMIPKLKDAGRSAIQSAAQQVMQSESTSTVIREVADALSMSAAEKVEEMASQFGTDLRSELLNVLEKARAEYVAPIMKLTAAITMAAGMYYMYHMLPGKPNKQGDDKEEPFVRVPNGGDQEENVWHNTNFRVTPLNRGPSIPPTQFGSIRARIRANTAHVIARRPAPEGKIMANRGNIVCVGGQLYVGNRHVLCRNDEDTELEIRFDENIGVSESFKVLVKPADFYIHEDKDLVFIVLGNVPPRKRITHFMPKKVAQFGICNGEILHRRENGTEDTTIVKAAHCDPQWNFEKWKNIPCWKGKATPKTEDGDCGAPYLLDHPTGPMFGGIHFAGSPSSAYAYMVTQEMCELAEQALSHVIVEQGSVDLSDADGVEVQLGPLHDKSVIRYLDHGQARVFGSFVGFRAKAKSKVTKTLIYDDVMRLGYPSEFGAPMMRGWKIWRNAIDPIVSQPFVMNQSLVREAEDAYLEDIIARVDPKWWDEFVPLDDVSVVNGYPGCRFIDAMNKQTSMGFPWRKPKELFLRRVDDPSAPYQEIWEFDSGFMARVKRIREAHLRGEQAHPIFTAHMKDEGRKWKRIFDQDTRQMSGCPADFVFHMRQYLLPFVRIFQSNSYIFEGAPGINHRSMQWDTLFHFLTVFGFGQLVAGDFKNYDKGMQATILMAVFRIMFRLALRAGWSFEQARVILCIGYDVCFVFMDFNGDLIQFFGGNPSGHSLTVIVNCIVNSLYMRIVFRMVGLNPREFKKYVNLMTYGDDNIMGVSTVVSAQFNHTAIQICLAEIGVVYTMADKTAESRPLISIWETTFLKRTWRFEPELGAIVAPLEEASIGKMLTVCIPSDALCKEAHSVEIVQNALFEYSLYGRARFDAQRTLLLGIIYRNELQDYRKNDFPDFDDLLDALRENYPGSCECIIESGSYLEDENYSLIEEWVTGENYIVSKKKPKCSQETQLLHVPNESKGVRMGVTETCLGDPRNIYLDMLPAGEQIVSTSTGENEFTPGGCNEQLAQSILLERDLVKLQSEPVTDTTITMSEMVTAENLTFSGGSVATPVNETGVVASRDQNIDTDGIADLGRFLSRPVLIHSLTWAENAVFAPVLINPWELFFSDTYIQHKLINYARVRCKLRLKFIVNASPFYYGSLRASYFPLDVLPLGRSLFGASSNNLVRYSQPPGVYLEPQSMSTVEMTLPFVWEGDWLDTSDLGQFRYMGTVGIVQYARLLSANDVVGAGVSVKVYAWAEDVEIAGLTKAPLLQSDEYEEKDGAISGTATAVASVARLASNVPMLAPYARMAEVGASAVSGMAKMFGYSNPPIIEDSKPVTVKSFHALANTDVCVPMDVLAIDPKNELAVSSAVNGFTGEDELGIVSLCARESFLLGSVWDSTMTTNTPLITSVVHPGLSRSDTGPPVEWHYTPMGYVSELFRYWRGSIRFKFRFIKTKYHRGRVSITWDPNFNIQSDADTETTNLTRIVDLEEETEVEMVIPYKSPQPYLETRVDTEISNSVTPAVNYSKDFHNGVLIMRVQNILTGPSSVPSITVLTFVSAADDIEFQVPGELDDTLTLWPTAVVALREDVVEQSMPVLEEEKEQSSKGSVTTGEKIASVRTVLHRTSLWSSQLSGSIYDESNALFTTGWRRTHNYLPKVPLGYGYNPDGCNWSASSPFSYNKNHPIDWVLNLFAAYKGSTNMTFNVNRGNLVSGNATDISEFSLTRWFAAHNLRPTKQNRNGATDFNSAIASSSISRSAVINAGGTTAPATTSGRAGVSLTNIRTQAGLQVHIPQYTNRRLLIAWGKYRNIDLISDDLIYENLDLAMLWFQQQVSSSSIPWPLVDIYYSAGIDFNPFYFVCTPRLTVLTPPSANNAAVP